MKYEVYTASNMFLGSIEAMSDDEAMKSAKAVFPGRAGLMLENKERKQEMRARENDSHWFNNNREF